MAKMRFFIPFKPCFLQELYLLHFRHLKNERSLFDVDIDIGTRGKGIRISQINFYHVISL